MTASLFKSNDLQAAIIHFTLFMMNTGHL